MLSRRADAFEDVSSQGSESQEARVERALRILDEQAALLMATEPPSDAPIGAHHARHNPHRRPLSSAAGRLIRAHYLLEGSNRD